MIVEETITAKSDKLEELKAAFGKKPQPKTPLPDWMTPELKAFIDEELKKQRDNEFDKAMAQILRKEFGHKKGL